MTHEKEYQNWRYGFTGEHFGLMKNGPYIHANSIIPEFDKLEAQNALLIKQAQKLVRAFDLSVHANADVCMTPAIVAQIEDTRNLLVALNFQPINIFEQ